MSVINVYEAKTNLSKLIDRAAGGEEVVIARHGKPVARLTQLGEGQRRVRFGVLRGEVTLRDDFDAPLPDEITRTFEGG